MKIGLVGSHGTGKTSTAALLQERWFPLAHIVDSSSRDLIREGYHLGLEATPEAQLLTTVKRINDILAATEIHPAVICDRTPLDSFAYTVHQMNRVWTGQRYTSLSAPYIRESADLVWNAMQDYDHLFFLRPQAPLEDDGVRPMQAGYQESIDRILEALAPSFGMVQVTGSLDEVVDAIAIHVISAYGIMD